VQETQPVPPLIAADAPAELFAFVGARAKVRAYNAFLQGQFRHSDTYSEDSLNQLLGEAWIGIEMRTGSERCIGCGRSPTARARSHSMPQLPSYCAGPISLTRRSWPRVRRSDHRLGPLAQ
jgi:hypothetical protein